MGERERRERAREERKSGEDERVLRGSALTSVLFLFLFFLVNLSIETMTSLAAFTNKARCVRVGARANQRQRVVRVFAEKPVKAEKPVPAKKPAPKKEEGSGALGSANPRHFYAFAYFRGKHRRASS